MPPRVIRVRNRSLREKKVKKKKIEREKENAQYIYWPLCVGLCMCVCVYEWNQCVGGKKRTC